MSNDNETPYVETMTADQLADAVREAHRDNDNGDVNHYCCRLTNRIADLERQLAESVSKADVEDALYDDWKRINRLSQCRLIDLGINPQLEKESNNEQR